MIMDSESSKYLSSGGIYTCVKCDWKGWGIATVHHHTDEQGHYQYRVEGTDLILCVG